MSKKQGKSRLATVVLVALLVVGLSLLLYPAISNIWNSFHQSQAITEYSEEVSDMSSEDYERLWSEAESYNRSLVDDETRFSMTESERAFYQNLLKVSDTGVMGSVEIPSLGVSVPIYHGTEESVLQVGAGHIEGSSLPTGGEGTHCALSGHRGLPSSELFTEIDKLEEGDLFILQVLDRTMTYQVDQILTVDPYDMEALAIDPQQDYCTLVTCTPYGINTHRLLVRGHRVPNQSIETAGSVFQPDPVILAAIAGVAAVVAVAAFCVVARRKQ